MADIKASDVKKLREKTGAGMMDCKKALVEAGGDFNKAEKILKELGLAAAAKRSDRATTEGRIFAKVESNKAAILELSCETDFVARNDDFIGLGSKLVDSVISEGYTEKNDEMEKMVTEAVSIIKENMSIRRFAVMDVADNEAAVSYLHGEGQIGVLVKLKAGTPEAAADDKVKSLAFDLALHIAAFNPAYPNRDAVDPAYLKEQEDIFRTQVAQMDKPEKVVEGIIKGKMNKHLSEICFLDQGFVKDDKQSVAKVVAGLGKELGTDLSVEKYIYYKVGEEA